jgi:hypothetical protein
MRLRSLAEVSELKAIAQLQEGTVELWLAGLLGARVYTQKSAQNGFPSEEDSFKAF